MGKIKEILLAFVCSFLMFPCGLSASCVNWEYTIEGAGVGVEGTYLLRVTLVSKRMAVSDDAFVQCAVHGVLFRGFKSEQNRQQQRPMTDAAVEQQHKDFFESFFANTSANYGTVVDGSRKVRKVGKKYNVSATVQVHKDLLRQYLEEQGIVRKLFDGLINEE